MLRPVTLPDAAKQKLLDLQDQMEAAEDSARSAQHRLALAQKRDPQRAKRAEQLRDQANAAQEALHAVVNRCNQWLAELPNNVVLELVAPPKVKLSDDLTLREYVGQIRDEIRGVANQLRVVKSAPPPKSDLKSQAKA